MLMLIVVDDDDGGDDDDDDSYRLHDCWSHDSFSYVVSMPTMYL